MPHVAVIADSLQEFLRLSRLCVGVALDWHMLLCTVMRYGNCGVHTLTGIHTVKNIIQKSIKYSQVSNHTVRRLMTRTEMVLETLVTSPLS
jgi:hypothetical protein